MSENTTTGGLVEELRALHVRGVEYSCRGCGQDWPCDTTSLLDAHASRTTEGTCSHTWPCPVHSPASSSPKPGAVGVLARLIAGLVGGRKWVELSYLDFADAVLTAGYLSPADVERAVAAAKAEGAAEVEAEWQKWCRTALVEWEADCSAAVAAEAWDEGRRVAEELDCEATVSWGRCGVAAWNDRPGPFNPYRAAGPERRTEPDEAVSADD